MKSNHQWPLVIFESPTGLINVKLNGRLIAGPEMQGAPKRLFNLTTSPKQIKSAIKNSSKNYKLKLEKQQLLQELGMIA